MRTLTVTLLAVGLTLAAARPALAGDPAYTYKDVTKPPPTVDVKKPTEIHANMTAGLVWVAGNAQSVGGSGTAALSIKHWDNQFSFNGGFAYVQSGFSKYGTGGPITDQKVSAENWLIKGRYDRYFLQKNTVFASFQSSGDKPSGYVYRLEPQAGYARLLYQSPKQLLRGEIGYDYTYEHRPFGTVPRNADYHSGRVFVYYENTFTPYASVSEGLEMLEAFNDLATFRLNSLTTLSTQVYKNISIKVNFKLMFNNNPPARPTNLVDPLTMAAFVPPSDNNHFDKVDTQLDVVLAVTFL